jgi:serine/threonine-protein kinase
MTCPSCGADNEGAAEVCFSCRTVLAAVSRGTLLASRYEIRDLLGRGGMGTVYRAHDRVLDEAVAIKVLRADLAQAPGMAERFLSEIKLARRVSHRNVCRIHEYGEDGRLRFISMELVDGQSLKEVLAHGPLATAQAFDVATQAARGLAAIHEVGIVHRDLKPANLTRDGSGRVRVMDFGIAKAAGLQGDTTAGYLLGSPEYMSPEQARGRGADFRSDLYALGVVAFELFTGAPPFRGETPVATLLLQIEAPLPLEKAALALPPALVPVLRRALAKDPRERQGSARELGDALAAAASGGVSGPPLLVRRTGPVAGRARRRAWLFWGGVAGAFFLGALGLALRAPVGEIREPAPVSPNESPTPAPSSAARVDVAAPSSPPSALGPSAQAGTGAGPRPRAPRSAPIEKPLAAPPPATTPESETRREPPAVAEQTAPAPSPPDRDFPHEGPAKPAPGFLLVVVSPWADVTIDGEPVGQTPLSRLTLAAGPHTVLLTHPEYQPYPRKILVKSGEMARFTVDLAQDGVRARP